MPFLGRVADTAAGMEFAVPLVPGHEQPGSRGDAGPTGFFGSGTLKGWCVTARLAEITVPTLITSGRYDRDHRTWPVLASTASSAAPKSA